VFEFLESRGFVGLDFLEIKMDYFHFGIRSDFVNIILPIQFVHFFVIAKTLMTSPRDATMVKNITKMCHELGIYVVAEMIENKEQADYLTAIGVDKGQGWLFSKAMPDVLQSIK
jgi:predicted signal transduction protein with EAL and GGDEF domain